MTRSPPIGEFREDDIAAMAAHDVAGDGQAEADAAGLRIARFLDAVKRPEDLLTLVGGHAGAVIVDDDLDGFRALAGADADFLRVALRIADKIDQRPPHCFRAHRGFEIFGESPG